MSGRASSGPRGERRGLAPSPAEVGAAGGSGLVLASRSPRRGEILARAGFRFRVAAPPEVEERCRGRPTGLVRANARAKCRALVEQEPLAAGEVALGADTVVVLDGEVLGKPGSRREAAAVLERLQGRWHRVVTGLHLRDWRGGERSLSVSTRVSVAPMTRKAIRAYLRSGEGDDKAGSYGIQGRMGTWVERVSGCYFNVVGLSPAAVRQGLERMGLSVEDYLDG